MNEEWITDRLPTAEDASRFGNIMIPESNEQGWQWSTRKGLKKGDPWYPYPKMPAYEPEKTITDWLKELPDGYRALALANYDKDYTKGQMRKSLSSALELAFSWKATEQGFHFWDSVDDFLIGKGDLPPLPEPEKRYWSKPSDMPSGAIYVMWAASSTCYLITSISDDQPGDQYSIHSTSKFYIPLAGVDECRWSDRPFDKFEDGKECLVE